MAVEQLGILAGLQPKSVVPPQPLPTANTGAVTTLQVYARVQVVLNPLHELVAVKVSVRLYLQPVGTSALCEQRTVTDPHWSEALGGVAVEQLGMLAGLQPKSVVPPQPLPVANIGAVTTLQV